MLHLSLVPILMTPAGQAKGAIKHTAVLLKIEHSAVSLHTT